MIWIYILLTIIVLTLLQLLLFSSLRKKSAVNSYFHVSKKNTIVPLLFGISTFLFYGILFIFLKETTLPQTNPRLVTDSNIAHYYASRTALPKEDLHQLEHDEFPTIETYYYLYTGTDTSQKTLQNTALYLRKNLCKKPCTISFYDNAHAYTLDHARASILTTADMQTWNDENYLFVANHYLGYLGSSQTAFTYFPFQDAYYETLLGK